MTRPTDVLAGNRKTATWTITLEDGSPALSSADIAVLRTDDDGTVSEITGSDVVIADTVTGGTVAVTVRFADDEPRGRVTVRLDIDDGDGPVYADQAVFNVEPASAQRPEP